MTRRPPLSITAACSALNDGSLSAVELARTVLDAIDVCEEEVGAFITIRDADVILEDAVESDRRRAAGSTLGPLDGIPIGHKDTIATTGIRTTAGSRVLENWIPDADAEVVRRLRAAGTILIGKLKCYEFAHSATDNPHFGRTRNPLDPDRITGGSSSGSAAALVAGFCLGTTGTDTGGSIRIPASFTGVVGLKPTAGLVSLDGVIPTSWSLDSVGPMATTASGAAALLVAMVQPDRAQGGGKNSRPRPFRTMTDLRGTRVGIDRGYLSSELTDDVAAAFESAVARMTSLGAEIVEVAIPAAEDSVPAEQAIVYPESTVAHEQWLEEAFERFGARIRKTLVTGYHYRAVDYIHAQQLRRVLFEQVEGTLRTVDMIATPATPIVAPRFEETVADAAGSSELLRRLIRFLVLANLTGHPAVSLPCGVGAHGMPAGLQLIGRRFGDFDVLSVAHAFERPATGAGAHA